MRAAIRTAAEIHQGDCRGERVRSLSSVFLSRLPSTLVVKVVFGLDVRVKFILPCGNEDEK